jgi:hypothetical protein
MHFEKFRKLTPESIFDPEPHPGRQKEAEKRD